MPKVDKIFTIDISPENFLRACSPEELQEVDLLLDKYLNRVSFANGQLLPIVYSTDNPPEGRSFNQFIEEKDL